MAVEALVQERLAPLEHAAHHEMPGQACARFRRAFSRLESVRIGLACCPLACLTRVLHTKRGWTHSNEPCAYRTPPNSHRFAVQSTRCPPSRAFNRRNCLERAQRLLRKQRWSRFEASRPCWTLLVSSFVQVKKLYKTLAGHLDKRGLEATG